MKWSEDQITELLNLWREYNHEPPIHPLDVEGEMGFKKFLDERHKLAGGSKFQALAHDWLKDHRYFACDDTHPIASEVDDLSAEFEAHYSAGRDQGRTETIKEAIEILDHQLAKASLYEHSETWTQALANAKLRIRGLRNGDDQ
jgi:hypothetical protein